MKSMKKIIAVILSVLMVIAISPLAFADDPAEPVTPEANWTSAFGLVMGEGTLAEAIANASNGQVVNLLKDITLTETVTFSKNATLKGNGFTITRDAAFADYLFTVTSEARIIFSGITVDGNKANATGACNALVNVENGSFTLDSGAKLINNKASTNGGAIVVGQALATAPACTLNMLEGSEISGCSALNGGAVQIRANAVFNMSGGTIKNCEANTSGGAIFLNLATSTFNMTGGTITENEASAVSTTGRGAAIFAPIGTVKLENVTISGNVNMANNGAILVGPRADFTIGGKIIIDDNAGSDTGSNVYLANNAVIKVDPELGLSEGSKISVTPANGFADGVNVDFVDYNGNITGVFYYDLTGETFFVSGDNVILMECITVTFDPGNGTCDIDKKLYAVDVDFGTLPVPNEREGFEFIGWYTANDVLITETSAVSFSEDITLYAKWKNLNELDSHPFAVIGRFFERIGNLMRAIFDFLANLFTGTGGDDALKDLK